MLGASQRETRHVDFLSSFEVPSAGDLPAYCRVLGFVRPAINFDIRIPISGWNGNFYEVGCGGFCGTLISDIKGSDSAELRVAPQLCDCGHGRGALGQRLGGRPLGVKQSRRQRRLGLAGGGGGGPGWQGAVGAYYGKAQDRSYFAGCSDVGRMAGIEVSRFPNEFDGVIMGAPALDFTGLVATLFTWIKNANIVQTDTDPAWIEVQAD